MTDNWPALPDDIPAATQRRELPRHPGVYRFYGRNQALLYVGKSIDLYQRVNSHFHAASSNAKESRLMTQTAYIEWELTAGELGALLKENQQIKTLHPIYNRRLRRRRKLWTLQLTRETATTPMTVQPTVLTDSLPPTDSFGLFTTKAQASKTLTELTRRHQLCRDTLEGKTEGKPCFARQLKQCQGICEGKETIPSHNARLTEALAPLKVEHWPYPGPIVIEEPGRVDPTTEEWHLIDRWAYLGTVRHPAQISQLFNDKTDRSFDLDAYFLISKAIANPRLRQYRYSLETEELTETAPSIL